MNSGPFAQQLLPEKQNRHPAHAMRASRRIAKSRDQNHEQWAFYTSANKVNIPARRRSNAAREAQAVRADD
jgi:hypothetical protein